MADAVSEYSAGIEHDAIATSSATIGRIIAMLCCPMIECQAEGIAYT
jgi:hypothetical protein